VFVVSQKNSLLYIDFSFRRFRAGHEKSMPCGIKTHFVHSIGKMHDGCYSILYLGAKVNHYFIGKDLPPNKAGALRLPWLGGFS